METNNVQEHPVATSTMKVSPFDLGGNNLTWTTHYGTVVKTVVKKGTGIFRPILDGSECKVQILIENRSQTSEENKTQFIIIGQAENDYSEFIEHCLKTMVEAEHSHFLLYHNSTNPASLKDTVGENNPKELPAREITLELISFDKPQKLFNEITADESFQTGQKLKDKGNKLFKEGNYRFAFKNYSKALKILLFFEFVDLPKEIEEEWDKTKCHCYLNLAACQMKSEQWEFVVENCFKALQIQPNNVKGLYRRSQANVKLRNFELAKSDILQCIKEEPNSKSACVALAEIEDKLKVIVLK